MTAEVRINDAVRAVEVAGVFESQCVQCRYRLGPVSQNYKLAALVERTSVDAVRGFGDPGRYRLDGEVELRRYYCPGCGVQFDAELAFPDADILWDVQLELPS